MDDPVGEPHHRHIAYDPAHQLVFVANRAMNRVDIFSTTTATSVGQVSIPGASSADLSLDGSTVWIGTVTEQVAAIDTASLQVKGRYEPAGLQPLPNTLFDRPEELLSLSNCKLMMRLRQSQTAEALLALWDPASNTLTNLTSTEPQLFQNGLGAMARTGDHTRLLIAASDSSGELAVYDANGNVLAGPHGIGIGTIPLVAANPDGTRFAVVFVSNGSSQVLAIDENGQRLFAITSKDGTAQNAGLTIAKLANVPLGIGTLTPANGRATGGTQITIHGSGFQNGATVTIGGKIATVTLKDMNTLTLVTPALPPGAQRLAITNPDGETVVLDAAFVAD
jgi:DNA-binding beta-propeller fold protein YncE